VKPVEEGVIGGIRYFIFKELTDDIFRLGKGGLSYASALKQRAMDILAKGMTKVGPCVKLTSLAESMAVNLIFEGIRFGIDVHGQRKKLVKGDITKDDFWQQVAKSGCECAGGAIGATAGALVLQLLIPCPFAGGFIGGVLGNIIGRCLGGLLGKQMHKA